MGESVTPPPEASLDAEALFRQYSPFVARFLARLGAPRAEIDDLVQEVFLIAHSRGGYLPAGAKPTTWLAQIATNLARNLRRKRDRRAVDHDQSVSGLPSPADLQARIAAVQALERAQEALEAMDVDHRAVFVLFEIEREACDAIAAGLGVPVGTVYSRLHAARALFREHFQRFAGTPAHPPTAPAR
jgi:RNA polymerase sigma-70 factor (ECF subfamily)